MGAQMVEIFFGKLTMSMVNQGIWVKSLDCLAVDLSGVVSTVVTLSLEL